MSIRRTRAAAASILVSLALTAGTSPAWAISFGRYEKVAAHDGTVSITMSRLADGKVHFYRYIDSGKEIAFFAVKASDGRYRTAFDACDSCYRSKKGYEQQGDKMNCRNCNQKFAIAKLGPNATGGCNPGYLPNQVSNNSILIKVDDLKAGTRYF